MCGLDELVVLAERYGELRVALNDKFALDNTEAGREFRFLRDLAESKVGPARRNFAKKMAEARELQERVRPERLIELTQHNAIVMYKKELEKAVRALENLETFHDDVTG